MLTFLIGVAWKVYAIFGYLWNGVRDAALHAYDWAVSKAAQARQAAMDFALEKVEAAKAWAKGWIDWVKALAHAWVEAAKSLAWGWVEAAKAWAKGWVDWLRSVVEYWIEAAKAWAWERIEDASAWVQFLLSILRSRLDNLTGVVMPWKPLIDSLIALLSPENLNRLTLLLVGFFPALLKLMASPLEWLYSTISGTFVTFLCYILAKFMGTTKYQLPPPPDWLSVGGGSFTPGPPGPDLSEGELSSPLDSLRISGYRFGPGHPGLDLGLSRGAPVYAMHNGTVEVAVRSAVGYGITLTLRNGKWWTRYAHLDSLGVGVGDSVRRRQKIAEGNSTGNSSGDHLHLEIKKNGVFIDPEPVLF